MRPYKNHKRLIQTAPRPLDECRVISKLAGELLLVCFYTSIMPIHRTTFSNIYTYEEVVIEANFKKCQLYILHLLTVISNYQSQDDL